MEGQPTEFEPVPMDSEDDLFIVYTSGTTSNPIHIVHSQAGYLLYAAFTHKVLLQIKFVSKAARQDLEWKAWVWGCCWVQVLVSSNTLYTRLCEEAVIMATLPHCFGDWITNSWL